MRICDIKKAPPVELKTIAPDRTVHDAVCKLVEFNIGALPVVNADGGLLGIITERDVLRVCAGDGAAEALSGAIADVMTTDLVVAVPDDKVDYVMRVMTEHRIRHLPVLEDHKLIDIVSIGDLVKSKGDEQATELRFLRDFVAQTG